MLSSNHLTRRTELFWGEMQDKEGKFLYAWTVRTEIFFKLRELFVSFIVPEQTDQGILNQ